MNLIFTIIFVINGFVYLVGFLDAYSKGEFKKLFSNAKTSSDNLLRRLEEAKDQFDASHQRRGYSIGTFLGALFFIALSFSPLVVPVLISLNRGFITGLLYYFVFELFFSGLIILLRNHQFKLGLITENSMLKVVVYAIFKLQLFLVIAFGFTFDVSSAINTISESSLLFKNTSILIFPVIYSSILLTAPYIYIVGLVNKGKEKQEIDSDYFGKRFSWSKFFMIIVLCSLGSLVYLSEIDVVAIVTNLDEESFYRTMDIYKFTLSALLIPVVIKTYTTEDKRHVKIEKHAKLRGSNNE